MTDPTDTTQSAGAQHANIYVALSAAQMHMTNAAKTETNPHFQKTYASLADVVSAVKHPLNTHGIAYFHTAETIDETHYMSTTLAHGESDTYLTCRVPLIVDRKNMQGYKSATTYAKRIGLESLTGVATDDDDGNDASSAPQKSSKRKSQTEQEKPQAPQKSDISGAIAAIGKCQSLSNLKAEFVKIHKFNKALADHPAVVKAKDDRKAELGQISADQFQHIKQLAEIAGVDIATICKAEGITQLHDLQAVAFSRVVDLLDRARVKKDTPRDDNEAPF